MMTFPANFILNPLILTLDGLSQNGCQLKVQFENVFLYFNSLGYYFPFALSSFGSCTADELTTHDRKSIEQLFLRQQTIYTYLLNIFLLLSQHGCQFEIYIDRFLHLLTLVKRFYTMQANSLSSFSFIQDTT